jgi:hypothetical protein
MIRSLLALAGRKTLGSAHRFLSTVALLLTAFIAFAQAANGQETPAPSVRPGADPNKSGQPAPDPAATTISVASVP